MFQALPNQPILIEISDLVKKLLKNPELLSAEYNKFQSNVCKFVENLTGRKIIQYPEAIQTLQEMSLVKNEQSKTLYEAIEKQQTELALLQQIITCLEYRYTLERLPQTDTPCMTALAGTNSGTGAWQKMWRLAVEYELDRMIIDHINPPIPAVHPVPPAGGSPPAIPPPSLRALLEQDFTYWAKQSAQLIADKAAGNVPTVVPPPPAVPAGGSAQAAPVSGGAAPLPPRGKRPKGALTAGIWTTGNYIRVEIYKPDYETWPSFQCGYNLYGELSGNIHTYNRSYDIHEINFTKSYRNVFEWLKPDANAIDPNTKEVDWKKLWTNRGLPV